MSTQPRHHLPSYGRLDVPAPSRAMTVISPQPPGPPPPMKTVSQQLYEAVQKVPDAQRQYLAEVDARDLTPDERIREARQFAAPVLDVAEAGFKQQADEYDAAYRQTLDSLKADVSEDGAARIRDRALDRLSHADSPVAAAQHLIENASNPQELGVILQEVPSWLESRGHSAALSRRLSPVSVRRCRGSDETAEGTTGSGNRSPDHRASSTRYRPACPAKHLMIPDKVRQYDPDA